MPNIGALLDSVVSSLEFQVVTKLPKYVPILKSKAAEYWALLHVSPTVLAETRPIFEIVAKKELSQNLSAFVNSVAPAWPQATALTVDTGYLDQMQAVAGTTDNAVLWIARALLERGVAAKSVMRLADDPPVLAEVAASAELHGQGACLRLGSPDSDPSIDEVDNLWPQVFQETGLPPTEVDLLIDLWAIQSQRDVDRAASVAAEMLEWAYQKGPWRSVTVASGAFPQSISNLPRGEATAVRRHDADLFARVVAGNPRLTPDFGDYGIWHPSMPPGEGYGPLPNLRYTDEREWQVYRESREHGTFESFYTICSRLVGSAHWPTTGADYSAGDTEIYRRAHSRPGPGTATHWLRWGASHHFAHVVDRLTSLGEP